MMVGGGLSDKFGTMSPDSANKLFDKLDTNNDGVLDRGEIDKWVEGSPGGSDNLSADEQRLQMIEAKIEELSQQGSDAGTIP